MLQPTKSHLPSWKSIILGLGTKLVTPMKTLSVFPGPLKYKVFEFLQGFCLLMQNPSWGVREYFGVRGFITLKSACPSLASWLEWLETLSIELSLKKNASSNLHSLVLLITKSVDYSSTWQYLKFLKAVIIHFLIFAIMYSYRAFQFTKHIRMNYLYSI